MLAYPKPGVVGTPFASDEWKKAVSYLTEVAKGEQPVRIVSVSHAPNSISQTKQRKWDDVPQWEMANVHLLFFELFERVYLVSFNLRASSVQLAQSNVLSLPAMLLRTKIWSTTLALPKWFSSMSVFSLILPVTN